MTENKFKSLFKYRNFSERSKQILLNKELWFTKPDELNDPFDCQKEHLRILEIALNRNGYFSQNHKNIIKNRIEDVIMNMGVCCFSRARKNQIMWSHYADEHKGFCIGFRNDIIDTHMKLFKPINVNYKSALPLDDINPIIKTYNNAKLITIANEITKIIASTKYSYWKYERETRIISHTSGLHKFDPKQVISIAFGLRMCEKHQNDILKILNNKEWSHVKLYKACKATDRFALEFIRL